jgi:predicted transcriptional regulator YdeE
LFCGGVKDRSGGAKNVKSIVKAVDFHLDQSEQGQEKNRLGAYTKQASHIQQEIKHEPAVIETLWGWFNDSIALCGDLIDRDRYGLLQYVAEDESAGYFYLLGVPIDDDTLPATAWITKTLPAQRCARFIHKGTRHNVQLTLDYIYHTWLSQANLQLRSSTILLHYGHGFEDSPQAETEVFVEVGS